MKRFVRKLRIARPENSVVAEIDAEFLLEPLLDVDLSQDGEAVLFECFASNGILSLFVK